MYFSNIANDELQHFHNTSGADFTMSLTDILTSNLFEVETIITDNLYRVYPLFYCKEIVTNNPNDKNLDNRVLILQKREHETYVSFMTEEQNNILLDETVIDIKQIGDKLSDADFNRMVYMFRKKGVITGNIDFENNTTITGQYATYNFENVAGQLRNDTGLIVNDKIKNNPITVKLQSPFFLSAKYSLVCTVRSLTGANVCDDQNADYKVIDTFTIDLIEDVEVPLDITNYTNDSVLDFVMEVDISFDVPEISSDFELDLSASSNEIYIDGTATITATLSGGSTLAGYLMKIYQDGVLVLAEPTGNTGVVEYTYTPEDIGFHIFSCEIFGMSKTININVINHTSVLSFNLNKTNIYYSQSITMSGSLSGDNSALSGETIRILQNNSEITTKTTNANGEYSYTKQYLTAGSYSLKAVYDGDNVHPSVSVTKALTVNKAPTSINATIPNEIDVGDVIPIKVVSSYGSFNPSGVTVKLYRPDDPYHLNPETTNLTEKDLNGNFNYTIPSKVTGDYYLEIIYSGNSNYGSSSKANNMHIFEAEVATITASKSGNYLIGNFKDSNGNNLSNIILSQVIYWITPSGSSTANKIILSNVQLDNDGDIKLDISNTGWNGSFYITYGDITSNTVTF